MGTKIEYAIDVLAPSSKSSCFSVDESDQYYSKSQGVNNNSFKITGLDKYHNNMPDKHNIDFIRKTMQIHEDIFKQQVRELHRVYSVQKMLMEEMKNNKKHYRNNNNNVNIEYDYRLKLDNLRQEHEISPRESCSSDIQTLMKIKTGFEFDLQKTNQDQDASISTSRIINEGDNDEEEEDEIELSLSIGGAKRSSKKLKLKNEQLQESSTPTTPISNSSPPTFDQGKKHPHWLFQGLSTNRTSSSTG
ncbi:hypothetical protein M5689_023050 [Euphorbia peplus]|nr:hypothetical protein M5689_023050 [Euphorbia peplus]